MIRQLGRLSITILVCALPWLLGVRAAHASDEAPLRVIIDFKGAEELGEPVRTLLSTMGSEAVDQVRTLDDVLDTGFGPWGILPPSRLVACTEASVGLADVQSELEEIEGLIQLLEYGKAQNRLARLESRLCAVTEPLPPRLLSRIPYLHGVVSYYADNPDGARESFRRAAEREPELEWDVNYPPDPQQLFLMGVGDALKSQRVTLDLSAEQRPERLVVDGLEVGAGETTLELKGERHVLQFGQADGTLSGVWLVSSQKSKTQLVGLDAVRSKLTSVADMDAAQPYLDILTQAATRSGAAEVLVMHGGPRQNRVWWYQAADGKWQDISNLSSAGSTVAGQRANVAGTVLLGAGAGVTAVGAILTLTQTNRARQVEAIIGDSAGVYDLEIDNYNRHKTASEVGIGVLGAGAATVVVGVISLAAGQSVHKKAGQQSAAAPVTWMIVPSGTWLGIQGKF